WTKRAQVEDRPEVNEERVAALAGEDLDAVAERVHGGRGQLRVVGGGSRADIDRRCGQAAREDRRLAVLDPGDLVGLRPVPAGAAEVRDRAGVVEEGVLVLDVIHEPELE